MRKLLNRYIKYYQDNPQRYWFKRKLYGWGWTPVRWQGWLTLVIFMVFVFGNIYTYEKRPEPTLKETLFMLSQIFLAITVLIFICYKTGEKPKWQWGLPKSDN